MNIQNKQITTDYFFVIKINTLDANNFNFSVLQNELKIEMQTAKGKKKEK